MVGETPDHPKGIRREVVKPEVILLRKVELDDKPPGRQHFYHGALFAACSGWSVRGIEEFDYIEQFRHLGHLTLTGKHVTSLGKSSRWRMIQT